MLLFAHFPIVAARLPGFKPGKALKDALDRWEYSSANAGYGDNSRASMRVFGLPFPARYPPMAAKAEWGTMRDP
jgi:hypothetical protein